MIVFKRFSELLDGPFRSWMIGHVGVENSAGADVHRDEYVKHAKGRCDGNQKVAGDDRLRVILNKGRPARASAAV